MPSTLESLLDDLQLTRCSHAREAGLWITSLPWPRLEPKELSLDGQPTSCVQIGRWPGHHYPRRLLLTADGRNDVPDRLRLTTGNRDGKDSPNLPEAVMEPFDVGVVPALLCEHHRLTIRHGGHSVGLAMGLRFRGEVHWWEACRLLEINRSHDCLTVEMGGAIEVRNMTETELKTHQGVSNPFLHKHNWLNGRIYARLHSNGVCEVFAHHINSKFFDAGSAFEGVVPVVGFHVEASEEELQRCLGDWTGSISELTLGKVRFDLAEAARLATPTQPGQMTRENGMLVWQPYLGAELYGGDGPSELTGEPYIFHAERQTFPQGMARTLRFSLSLSERSPHVARYLAPAEWYEKCEEFFPNLQLLDDSDDSWEKARQWTRSNVLQGGFEDGSLPRHLRTSRTEVERIRHEPGWEGELPYAQFLTAWRTCDAEDYAVALRAAYYFTDVAVDHSVKLVRMHASAPPAIALPMNRMQGTVAAYLETGDPYLLETAEAVTGNSHWLHKNSWPRMAVGRDACFVRSAVLLYRYFGDEFYRRIAFEGVMSVVESQRENGSFGDQGGGSGIHQTGGYVTKPWMGLLALNGVLDYLELFPEEVALRQSVRKFADWLMAERQVRNGIKTWCFQHDYNGKRSYYHIFLGHEIELPSVGNSWHHETLARLLGYAAEVFHEPSYIEAWRESHSAADACSNDHSVAAALQFLCPANLKT